MTNRILNFIFLVILIIASYSNFRVFKSSQEQLPLLADFNYRQGDPVLSIEVVEQFQHEYPNLNNTVIPLELLKANYYVRDIDLTKTLDYTEKGSRKNPFLFIGEFQRGRVYYKLNKMDSAYYYLKKATKGLPRNQSHITHFQLALGNLEKLDELDSLFKEKKIFAEEAIWQNQVYFKSSVKLRNGIKFNKTDSLNVTEASKKYPNNRVIKIAYQTIFSGLDKISSANLFDREANLNFEQKNYDDAVKFWKKAIEIIPDDQAYYYNIARSLTLKKNFKSSDSILKKVFNSEFIIDDGEIEFLMAMNYIDDVGKNSFKVCNLLKTSYQKGYTNAKNIYDQLDQQIGCN